MMRAAPGFWRLPGQSADWLRAVVYFAAAGVAGFAAPVATQILFDWVVPQTDWPALAWLVAGMMAAALAASAWELAGGRGWLRVGGRAEWFWVPRAWTHLAGMPRRWLHETGPVESGARAQAAHEIVTRIMEGAPRLHAAVAVVLSNTLFLFFVDPFLGAVGLLCAGSAWLALLLLHRRRTRALEEEFDSREALHAGAVEWIRGFDSLRLNGGFDFVRQRASALMARSSAARRRVAAGDGWRAGIFAGATALPCLILFAAVDKTDLALGPFLAFLVAFGSLVGGLRVVADSWPMFAEIRALVHRARPLWEAAQASDTVPKPRGEIVMEGVSFRYTPDSPRVLENFSMRIEPGEIVGLTGPAGAGKTTILRLLAGLERAESGRVIWGQDGAAACSPAGAIGAVWARGRWYPGDLRRNLLGEADLPVEAAWEAAELTGLAGAIRALPMQMHTLVAEGAANFSAGERQRLLIARALAKKPRVLLLDDAMRPLDRPMMRRVMKSLRARRITCVVASSRRDRLPEVDRRIELLGRVH